MVVAGQRRLTQGPDEDSSGIIAWYWQGAGPLWRIYWIYGVLGSTVLAGLYWGTILTGVVWPRQALLLVLAGYTVWIVVSVWRCAPNAANPLYGQLARVLTIAWAANALLLLLFLELDLLGRLVPGAG